MSCSPWPLSLSGACACTCCHTGARHFNSSLLLSTMINFSLNMLLQIVTQYSYKRLNLDIIFCLNTFLVQVVMFFQPCSILALTTRLLISVSVSSVLCVLCYAALAAISIEHHEAVSEGLCWCTHAGYYLIIKDAFGVSGGGGAVTSHLQLTSLMLGCRRLERNAAV